MDEQTPEQVRFFYIKSNHFRVVHVDGAHGGLTPSGLIQMALFNDRIPIPQQTLHPVTVTDAGKKLGAELQDERVARDGIVREVEVEALMAISVAKTLHTWLGDKIAEWEEHVGDRGDSK